MVRFLVLAGLMALAVGCSENKYTEQEQTHDGLAVSGVMNVNTGEAIRVLPDGTERPWDESIDGRKPLPPPPLSRVDYGHGPEAPPPDDLPSFVDEANIVGKFDSTEALGKAYPRIAIDGVKCEYDPAQKWFLHAEYGCRVMWMEAGNDKMLMGHLDWRGASNAESFKNKDGDIRLVALPLQIMKDGRWIDLRPGDVIHLNAAIGLGLQAKDQTPSAGDLRRIGNSGLWATFDGHDWKLVSTHDLPKDVKDAL